MLKISNSPRFSTNYFSTNYYFKEDFLKCLSLLNNLMDRPAHLDTYTYKLFQVAENLFLYGSIPLICYCLWIFKKMDEN